MKRTAIALVAAVVVGCTARTTNPVPSPITEDASEPIAQHWISQFGPDRCIKFILAANAEYQIRTVISTVGAQRQTQRALLDPVFTHPTLKADITSYSAQQGCSGTAKVPNLWLDQEWGKTACHAGFPSGTDNGSIDQDQGSADCGSVGRSSAHIETAGSTYTQFNSSTRFQFNNVSIIAPGQSEGPCYVVTVQAAVSSASGAGEVHVRSEREVCLHPAS